MPRIYDEDGHSTKTIRAASSMQALPWKQSRAKRDSQRAAAEACLDGADQPDVCRLSVLR